MILAMGFNKETNQITFQVGRLVFDCQNTKAVPHKNCVVVCVDVDAMRPEVANTIAEIASAHYGKPALVETRNELFNGSERVVHASVLMVANALLGLVIE